MIYEVCRKTDCLQRNNNKLKKQVHLFLINYLKRGSLFEENVPSGVRRDCG
jgi:hypothetical protein